METGSPDVVRAQNIRQVNVAGDYRNNSQTSVQNVFQELGKHPLDRLVDNIVSGAINDSDERFNAPKCAEETRIAVQDEIVTWILHGNRDHSPKRVLWIAGPAGTGKTAIAGSIADICAAKGWLAASFFFSSFAGSQDRRSKRRLIATLVYQLIQHDRIKGFKEEVLGAISRDPVILRKSLTQQVEADPAFPFRIIVLSRPEAAIRDFFSTHAYIALEIFLDDKYNPDRDVATFFRAKFNEIRRRFNLLEDWVPDRILQYLVREASGQFIYAATVVRFIEIGTGPPQEQLKRVLDWRRREGSTSSSSRPFAPLDALYTHILKTSPNPILAVTWLRAILAYGYDAPFMECLLESSPGETEHLLGPLRSLLRLYDKESEPDFQLYHKSVQDFLEDVERSAGLYITLESTADLITQRCYRILKNRGPEGSARFSLKHNPNNFFTSYCDALTLFIDLSLEVDIDDVQWCAPNVQSICSREGRAKVYPRMFASVHRECSMLYCRPACRIWRGEILRRCKSMDWKVPGMFETLRDKYRKYDAQFDDNFPLRPYSELELTQLVLPLPNQESPWPTGRRMPGAWSSELY